MCGHIVQVELMATPCACLGWDIIKAISIRLIVAFQLLTFYIVIFCLVSFPE